MISNIINDISKKFDALKNEVAIFLILNIQGETDAEQDYQMDSITSEYFTLKEAQGLIDGFDKLEIYKEIFYSEKEFVAMLASGNIKRLPYKYKIVYSSTGTGVARSKSALIPALCNLYNLIYCSNDTYTAALLENKVHVLNLLNHYNFPLPEHWIYDPKQGWQDNKQPKPGMKLIAKPAYECASLSISDESVSVFTDKYNEFIVKLSRDYNQPIIVEEFINGFEVEVPLFDLEEPFCPMAVGIKESENEEMGDAFLTYKKVSEDDYEFYNFELRNKKMAEEIKKIAIESFKMLNLTGIIRVDFRISKEGKPYIMDYNNSPHLTVNHSCAYSIVENGFRYEEMLLLLLWKGIKPTNY